MCLNYQYLLKKYCLEVAESTQTPPDMAFVSALAIIALAMQKNYKVVGKADWEEQLSLYVMIVAEPSDRKSAVLLQMIKVINAFEANYNETHSLELEKNHDEYSRLTSAKAKVLKNLEKGKATQDEYDDLLEKISKFKKLNRLTLTLDDVTSESIATKMSEQGGCIAIVSSEGGMIDIISEEGKLGGEKSLYEIIYRLKHNTDLNELINRINEELKVVGAPLQSRIFSEREEKVTVEFIEALKIELDKELN